jgi:hypothetical protein
VCPACCSACTLFPHPPPQADLSAFAPLSDSLAPLSDSLNPRRLLPGSGPGKRGDIKGKHLLSAHESAHESAHQSTHESALLRGTLQHPKGLTVGPIARQVDSPAQAVHVGAVFKLAAGRMLPGGGKGKHLLSTAPTTLSTSSGAIHQTAGTGHHQQDGLVLSAGRMLPGGGKGKHMLSTAATTLSTASDGSHQAAIAGHHQQDSLVLSAGRMLPGGGKGKHLLASLALSPTASGGSQQTAAQLTGTAAQHQQQDSSAQSVVMTAGRMLPGGGKGRLLLSVVAPKNAIV